MWHPVDSEQPDCAVPPGAVFDVTGDGELWPPGRGVVALVEIDGVTPGPAPSALVAGHPGGLGARRGHVLWTGLRLLGSLLAVSGER